MLIRKRSNNHHMEPQQHNIVVPKKARYYLLGNPKEEIKQVWWVFHGYGQLARFFIRHFELIAKPGTLVIAPEGHSRFYLSEKFERIGASWMTREDRLDEIADQHTYLNMVHETWRSAIARSSPKVTMLGFSQGVPTVWRWLEQQQHIHADKLILWAGLPPEETAGISARGSDLEVHVALGDDDPFITNERLRKFYEIVDSTGLPYTPHEFSGGHVIDPPTLLEIAG